MRKLVDFMLVIPLVVAIGYLLFAAAINGTLLGNPTATLSPTSTATVAPVPTATVSSTPTRTQNSEPDGDCHELVHAVANRDSNSRLHDAPDRDADAYAGRGPVGHPNSVRNRDRRNTAIAGGAGAEGRQPLRRLTAYWPSFLRPLRAVAFQVLCLLEAPSLLNWRISNTV